MISAGLYILCGCLCLVCAVLLLRAYCGTRNRLLLWSGLGFCAFTLSNGLVFVDLVIFPTQLDLSVPRTLLSLLGIGILLYGLIWES